MNKLRDLNPKWTGLLRPNSGEGMTLDCPRCGPSHKLAVYFSNPVDGLPAASWQTPQWHRDGEKFESLTIKPSIQYPCFHGWIENGDVIDISESPLQVMALIDGRPTLVALSPMQFKRLRNSSI